MLVRARSMSDSWNETRERENLERHVVDRQQLAGKRLAAHNRVQERACIVAARVAGAFGV